MPEITGIESELIESTMRKAHIPGVSIAYRDGKTSTLSTTTIGRTDTRDTPDTSTVSDVQPDTPFGAASLSKPVFAYLVLKLIDEGKLSRPGESAASGLDRPLYEILPLKDFFSKHSLKLSEADIEVARSITPRMLLAHTSGINDHNAQLNFTPGKEYTYSGMGLFYLQAVVEKATGEELLEVLAQEYVFSKLKMEHSSFVPPEAPKEKACAANSLFTTPSDYAVLMNAWMQDKSTIMQEAFEPQISLIKDNQIFPSGESAKYVDTKVKERLAWGLGLGLELDETGKAVKAFHTGDMNQFRAQMALDLEKKSCIVYFSNADKDLEANGHVLGPLIITPKIPVDYAHTWFYSKFPFALHIDQLSEESRFGTRVQGEDKKADSDAVMAVFMSISVPTPAPSTHEKREESGASPEVQAGSYAVMGALMPSQSPAALSTQEIKKQSTEESSRAMVVEVESPAETDKPSPPSPFKITPKAPGEC
ncbi:serine hydrolase domain-containing protein [Legionella quateirensis]|uniref:Secreted esterase n=1 Tax=Legionella quateirensis TaxID=45072 RepID=A0A378L106_9GAMM|nr:serine hydrolase domain-containing protein [Legionella quateirensis]KTD50974.1 putative secreted esterase [Legionella quateirensis]STY17780.1 putative secreted esterase [Legionella quateirensis]